MIVIKFQNKVVTPMPSAGLFSDNTVPNCDTEACCLVKAARVLGLAVPALTAEEYFAAVAAQVADGLTATDIEVMAERDAIRGFTDKQVQDYIRENSTEEVLVNGVLTKRAKTPPTEAQAKAALIKKTRNPLTGVESAVVVPADATIRASLIAAKELVAAQSKVNKLIEDGFLVTANIPDSFRAQFEVVEIA